MTTARFSCLYGLWYPHTKDPDCFLRALFNECYGTALAMRRIRRVTPEAKLVLTEDIGKTFSTPLRVNRSVRADARFAAFSRNGAMWGDYNQLAVAKDGTVYISRCESYSTVKGEDADFPPTVHHQRTWVAAVKG